MDTLPARSLSAALRRGRPLRRDDYERRSLWQMRVAADVRFFCVSPPPPPLAVVASELTWGDGGEGRRGGRAVTQGALAGWLGGLALSKATGNRWQLDSP